MREGLVDPTTNVSHPDGHLGHPSQAHFIMLLPTSTNQNRELTSKNELKFPFIYISG